MKKLTLIGLFILSSCAGQPKVNKQLNGIFEGTAPGRNGDITVSVTVDSGIITGITLIQSDETPQIGAQAFMPISDAILEKNNINVDAVSGSTMTSEGFVAAIEDALSKSGTSFKGSKIKPKTMK